MAWESVGRVEPERLIEARKLAHHAAQPTAAPGKLLLPRAPDFSEQSFAWLAEPRLLAQGTVAAARPPFRSALRIAPLAVVLAADSGASLDELTLAGRTLDDAYAWLEAQTARLLGTPLPGPFDRGADLPAHPVADGAAFPAPDLAALRELEAWFAAGAHALDSLRAATPGASAVVCWPHHFDLATLITLAPAHGETADGAEARTVGVGLSPGDDDRPLPYWYVNCWPYPDSPELPPLPAGEWHTEDWVGAVLPAEALLELPDGAARAARLDEFLRAAIAACTKLTET